MTLTELYTSRIDALTSRINDKKNALSDAKNQKSTIDEEVRFWTGRVSALGANITKAEASLQVTATVAEIESIAKSLRRLRIDRRASTVKLSHYKQQQSSAEQSVANRVEDLGQQQKDLKDAAQELASITELEGTHQSWFDAISLAPLASAPSDADGLITSHIEPAIAKLEAQTSEEFIKLVTDRVDQYWQQQDDLVERANELDASWDANLISQYGHDGNIDIQSRKFDVAIANLSEFVANAQAAINASTAKADKIVEQDLLNSAQKSHFDALMALGDINADVLAPEADARAAEHELRIRKRELEVARAEAKAAAPDISDADLDEVPEVKAILEGPDSVAAKQAALDAALSTQGFDTFDAVIEKELAVSTAVSALALATSAFVEANPEDDPLAAPELDAARDAVDDANDELAAAQNTMRGSPWYKLEELEVAIPDSAWLDIVHLLGARRKLTQLKNVDLATLEAALKTANTDLAQAISEEITADDGYLILSELVNRYQQTHENALAKGSNAAFETTRGLV